MHENLKIKCSCASQPAFDAAPILQVPLMTASFIYLVPHLFQVCCIYYNEAIYFCNQDVYGGA